MDYQWIIHGLFIDPGIPKQLVSRLYLMIGVMGRKTGGWVLSAEVGETPKKADEVGETPKKAESTASPASIQNSASPHEKEIVSGHSMWDDSKTRALLPYQHFLS